MSVPRRRKEKMKTQRLQMTPLIDVVFLLLAFFIMTFKTLIPEGDFGINVPIEGENAPTPVMEQDVIEPLRIRLSADVNGNLSEIQVGTTKLGTDLRGLRRYVMELLGPTPTPQERTKWEAEIQTDYHLKYRYTIEAFTQISGYIADDNIVPLIEKINIKSD